jgi:sulfide:quinone oxidoreductase
VLIAGGGIAGLEVALALADMAGELADLSLVTPEPDFVYKPLTVEEPFTRQPAERRELEPALAEIGVGYVRGALETVDPAAHAIELANGTMLSYDILVVCIGARAVPVYEGATTFWSFRGDIPIDELLDRASRSGRELTLIVPPGTSWALPIYELALLLRRRSEERGLAVSLRVITPEGAPLLIFGRPASDAVATLLAARGIEVQLNTYVADDLHMVPEAPAPDPELTIALPRLTGPSIKGLQSDDDGFILVDRHGRVSGADDVYAAGDGTDFPVKQGGLATQQADSVAAHIAARLGAGVEARPFEPVLRGQLITGMESLNLKHELAGGRGSGVASLDYLWWPPQKVSGRYLSAWLSGESVHADLEPPFRPLEVEISVPHEWHGEPLSSQIGSQPSR